MEIWKPVLNYEGYYEVSNHGRVRSVERIVDSSIRNGGKRLRPSRMLKQNPKRNGYLTVDLCKKGKIKTTLVHRIVASAFIPKTENLDYVNHINLNKQDNRVENLEWCTAQYNSIHCRQHKEYSNGLKKRIRCVETGMDFDSSYQAAEWVNKKFGYTKDVGSIARSIRGCATGYRKQAAGYRWKDVIE